MTAIAPQARMIWDTPVTPFDREICANHTLGVEPTDRTAPAREMMLSGRNDDLPMPHAVAYARTRLCARDRVPADLLELGHEVTPLDRELFADFMLLESNHESVIPMRSNIMSGRDDFNPILGAIVMARLRLRGLDFVDPSGTGANPFHAAS